MDPLDQKGIPRTALLAVALAAVGTAVLLLNLASRPEQAVQAVEADDHPVFVETAGMGAFEQCADCHADLDRVFKVGGAPGILYTHEEHFESGVSDCAMCHPANTHEPDLINRPTMTRCFMCHGLTEQAMAPGTCETCHPSDFPDRPASHAVQVAWVQQHGEEATIDAFQCATCHEETYCSSCHGLAMPHPDGWKETAHAESFFEVGTETCTRCHERATEITARTDCDSCHHQEGDPAVPWRQAHPSVVKDAGAITCFDCHSPVTCAACHVRDEQSFIADQDRIGRGRASPGDQEGP
jgi:hypothetical protein